MIKIDSNYNINVDLKKTKAKLLSLQKSLKTKIEKTELYNELKTKVKHSNDVKKVVAIVEQRRKQIERLARTLPKEVKQVKTYLHSQRKELEKMGEGLIKRVKAAQSMQKTSGKAKSRTTAKRASAPKGTTKKAAKRR